MTHRPPPCYACLARDPAYRTVDGWPYCAACIARGEPKRDKRMPAQGSKKPSAMYD